MDERPLYRRSSFVSLLAILLVAVAAIAIHYSVVTRDRQSTDNAFVEARAEAGPLLVVANFRRTQLVGIRPGQSAMITVPDRPDQVLRGHVDAIDERARARAPGPRVPVRIVVDQPPDPGRPLGPGMAVVATVILR
jgi:multidrug resistance efflux pump